MVIADELRNGGNPCGRLLRSDGCEGLRDGDIDLRRKQRDRILAGAVERLDLLGASHLILIHRSVLERLRSLSGLDAGLDLHITGLGHQRDGLEHIEAADRTVRDVDVYAMRTCSLLCLLIERSIRKCTDGKRDEVCPVLEGRDAGLTDHRHRRGLDQHIRIQCQQLVETLHRLTTETRAELLSICLLSAHRACKRIVREQPLLHRIRDDVSEETATDNCNLLHCKTPSFFIFYVAVQSKGPITGLLLFYESK